MSVPIKVPSVGESVQEVTIATWLKAEGESVETDEVLCELESDKATIELTAEASGVLKITIAEGETVAIGSVIGELAEGAGKTEPTKPPPLKDSNSAPPPPQVPQNSNAPSPEGQKAPQPGPAARKILKEKSLSPSQVTGSGTGGRITKGDALSADAPAPKPSQAGDGEQQQAIRPAAQSNSQREETRTKMTGLRKAIARRLVEAKNSTAMLTTFNEVDMTAIMALRKSYKEIFKEKHQIGLGFMSFFTKACTLAAREYPAVNGQIEGDHIVTHNYCDVGIAVSTPKGLVVPVVRNAHELSLAAIEREILRLAHKARDNKITIEDMSGGTFTITNGGVFGSMLSTPILNLPQSAILGMHNIVERAVVKNGQIVVAPVMYLALSYDHRIVDGRESVSFLKRVVELIQDPSRLLLEV